MSRFRNVALAAALALSFSTAIEAQDSRAALTGTVTDPQGAVIARAAVVARNLATNAETRTSIRFRYAPAGSRGHGDEVVRAEAGSDRLMAAAAGNAETA